MQAQRWVFNQVVKFRKKIDKDVRVKTSGRVIAVSQTSDSSAVGLHAGKTTFISQRKGLTVSWY